MRVAVIGQGYVGLPLAKILANSGFDVIGFDIDKELINELTITQLLIKIKSLVVMFI